MISYNLKDYLKVYDNFLTPDECSATLEDFTKIAWEKHSYSVYNGNKTSYDDDLSITSLNTNNSTIIQEKVWYLIPKYIDDVKMKWFNSWHGYTPIRYNKYDLNTKMRLHCDHIHSMFDGIRKGIPILSILGSLNDNYDGGELVFWENEIIELKAGQVMVFPSNFLYPHEVKPVKNGVRYSYVSWVW
jgi:hypothetical protein